jgi:hypothetical protein
MVLADVSGDEGAALVNRTSQNGASLVRSLPITCLCMDESTGKAGPCNSLSALKRWERREMPSTRD